MKKVSSILWGVVLVAAGVILALNAFGITSINIFFDGWWTLIIIVPCVIGLFTNHDKGGNIIGICIGAFLLLCCQDVLSFDMFWKLLIPAAIVIIGINIIISNVRGNKGTEVYKMLKDSGAPIKNATATFSGTNVNFDGEVFDGAVIEKDCVINASAIFGGIDIFVPDNLNVKINSTSVFGGVSDKKCNNNQADRPTLYINATCLFGGVDVK